VRQALADDVKLVFFAALLAVFFAALLAVIIN
jgi:hypothetical protein